MPTLALIHNPSLGRENGICDSFWLMYPLPPPFLITGHRLMCKESVFLYHKCILKQVKKDTMLVYFIKWALTL